MKIKTIDNARYMRTVTKKSLHRLLSPLCGLNTNINFICRERAEPKILTAGAELTGVHILQELASKHRPGSHHIGGSGTYLNEVLIKVVGETIERYCQLISEKNNKYPVIFSSYNEMIKRNEPIISIEKLNFFSEQQFLQSPFPFQSISMNSPLSWVQAYSLTSKTNIWIPAQLVFVGYKLKSHEPWLFSAVTTGTAAHTNPIEAIRNALLELIQIDTAMGHWYTNTDALAIRFDKRTELMANYIKNTLPLNNSTFPQFFYLKNADLTDFTIACVFENKAIPKVAVGLGADTRLLPAMQKAYLEAIGVMALSKLVLIDKSIAASIENENAIFDLDTNVALYGKGRHHEFFKEKFNITRTLNASQLPADIQRNPEKEVYSLIDAFISKEKELFYFDLTTQEAAELGFVVSRLWSPDVLSLCLPSTVPTQHPRFKHYGNVAHAIPHPYP